MTPEEELQDRIFYLLDKGLPNLVKQILRTTSLEKLATKITKLSQFYVEAKLKELEVESSRPAYDYEFDKGQDCICGHPYNRHFDSYDDMAPIGCKYCTCRTFKA